MSLSNVHSILPLTYLIGTTAAAAPAFPNTFKLPPNSYLRTHAILGTLAWGLVFPLGAILFALSRYPSSSVLRPPFANFIFRYHAALQTLGLMMYIAAFGFGVYLHNQFKKNWNDPHYVIGIVVLILMTLQPIWGIVHHNIVKRRRVAYNPAVPNLVAKEEGASNAVNQPVVSDSEAKKESTTAVTGEKYVEGWKMAGLVHRWVGRATIILGMINGGLGLKLTKNAPWPIHSAEGQTAYIVVVPIIAAVWALTVVGGWVLRKKSGRA